MYVPCAALGLFKELLLISRTKRQLKSKHKLKSNYYGNLLYLLQLCCHCHGIKNF